MEELLKNFCNNKIKKGLLLFDMPTGIGKTYNVAKFIANNYEKIHGKIIFVTQLKKNLPEEDLRNCFKEIGKEQKLDEILLRVENNVDNLILNFHLVKDELLKYIGDSLLINKIEKEIRLITNVNINDDNAFLVQQAKDDLQNELEKELRNKVTAYLKTDIDGNERTKEQKRDLIDNNDEYKWIQKLYPAINTDSKKILIMSLDKFLYRYSTIIEPPFNLYESNLISKGIVFIDEFDSSKDVILKKIIKDGLDNQFGIIELFRAIYVGLFNPDFTKLLLEESKYNREHNEKNSDEKRLLSPEKILNSLKAKAKELYENCKFNFQFKLDDNQKEKPKFLFQDYKTHTLIDKYIYLEEDKDHCVNWIKAVNYDDIPKTKVETNESQITIEQLVRQIQSYLKVFQTCIGFMADNYYHLRQERDKDVYNISRESAIRTVLSEFGLDGKYQNYLTLNILSYAKRNKFDWRQLSDIIDASVYENGFRYYHLVDSENHDTFSKMDYIAFNDSPEKFLCRLINRTKVVGISATATIPSPLCNYDLDYLKAKNKDLIFTATDEDKIRLKKYYRKCISNYDKVEIICQPLGVNSNNLHKEIKNDYEYYVNELDGKENEYLKNRLLCFVEAVEFFLKQENANLKSFLYFANTKGKEYNNIEKDLLNNLFNKLQKHHTTQGQLEFLHGSVEEFEKNKNNIKKSLEEGKKVFVITTYATMGAGQNIHYNFDSNNNSFVKINNLDYNNMKKDFDIIYLEKPSNIIVNNYRKIESDEDLVKYIFQIKFLQEKGDFTSYEVKKKIKLAFQNREFGNVNHYEKIKTKNLFFAYAKVLQQAIGRICRTSNKNEKIYIFYQDGLEDYIAPIADYYNDKLINPEFKEFINKCKLRSKTSESINNQNYLKRLADTKDERSIQYKNNLRSDWNNDNIEKWERIREEVLKKPTIQDIDSTEFNELYIELPNKNNKYYIRNGKINNKEEFKYSFDEANEYFCVDENNVLLPQVLKIPGVKEYFKEKGYAINFEPNKYMLSYSILKSIYQGALGEVVGEFILTKKMFNIPGLKVENLPTNVYEKFDKIVEGVYIDYKNWASHFDDKNLGRELDKIRGKMKSCSIEKVIIVNMLKPNQAVATYRKLDGGKILLVPYLYDIENNKWNVDGLKKIYEMFI